MKNRLMGWGLCLLLTLAGVVQAQVDRSGEVVNERYDIVWDRTIEYLMLSGMQIKVVDKNAGYIYAEAIKMENSVLKCTPFKFKKMLSNTGRVSVLVKENGDESKIMINLNGTSQWSAYDGFGIAKESPVESVCYSTGFFEKNCLNYVSTGEMIYDNESNNLNSQDGSQDSLLKLLVSESPVDQRKAAIYVFDSGSTSSVVYDKISEILFSKYKETSLDHQQVDALSWLCKALSSSNELKYKNVLEEVMKNAQDRKLRKHARASFDKI